MNLRRLRYFVTLAQELHFGRAAEKLHVAQPALTQNLRLLEQELGLMLLARTSRKVELTEAGRVLLREAQQLLAKADSLARTMRDLASGSTGTLRLNYARSAPGGRSSAIVDAFRASCPGARLEINSQYTMRSVDELLAGTLDAAFVRSPIMADGSLIAGLEEIAIDSEPLVVALPARHRLAARSRVARLELRGEPLVTGTPERAPGFYAAMFRQIWGEAGPRVVLQEPDEEHMLRAVAAGTGLSILTRSRADLMRVPGVEFRRFASPEPQAGLALTWMTANPSATLAAFVAAARGALAEPAPLPGLSDD